MIYERYFKGFLFPSLNNLSYIPYNFPVTSRSS